MKIILAIPSLDNGGAEKLVVELANELALHADVSLISLKSVEDHMLPAGYLSDRVNASALGKKKGLDFRVLPRIYNMLRKNSPEIVHLHLNLCLLYFLPIIPFFPKIKFHFTIHSSFESHETFFGKLNRLYFFKGVRNVCLTSGIRDKFIDRFPKLDFSVIANGINQKAFNGNDASSRELNRISDEYGKVILFVGRLTYSKNIPLLLDVFDDKALTDTKLLIIGDGDGEIKSQIIERTIRTKNRIQYLGKKSNILEYMCSVDALILASNNEGLPLVILEAMSVGLPVIATPVGGIPDIVTQMRNGILAKGIQRSDIINAVIEFKNLEKREIEEISKNNKEDFNGRFSMQICALNHLKLYQQPKNSGFSTT